MAQGAIKKGASVPKSNTQRKQTGARIIKPKKPALIKQQKMKKKHSSGLSAMTERTLAERAGHLEMLKGGKKERNAEKAAAVGKPVKKGK